MAPGVQRAVEQGAPPSLLSGHGRPAVPQGQVQGGVLSELVGRRECLTRWIIASGSGGI